MLFVLLAAVAAPPQAAWVLPPPRLDLDDTVTYARNAGRPRARPRRVWRWRRGTPRFAPVAAATGMSANAVHLRQGDILIDTARHRLTYAVSPFQVQTYPVAVGRQGASWKGTAVVGRKVVFPTWRPTPQMRSKERYLPSFVAPGRHNPLGTRALYLYRNGRDTMFRIHGTNAPWSIGKSVSHGCIRMLNASVERLYAEVRIGAHVTVQ